MNKKIIFAGGLSVLGSVGFSYTNKEITNLYKFKYQYLSEKEGTIILSFEQVKEDLKNSVLNLKKGDIKETKTMILEELKRIVRSSEFKNLEKWEDLNLFLKNNKAFKPYLVTQIDFL